MRKENNFKSRVYDVVGQIPRGKVMTYGQIAVLCGNPRSARIVGGLAHFGPEYLPWQRVVKKDGSLAQGYPGGLEGHKQVLSLEGVVADNYKIDIEKYQWAPSK